LGENPEPEAVIFVPGAPLVGDRVRVGPAAAVFAKGTPYRATEPIMMRVATHAAARPVRPGAGAGGVSGTHSVPFQNVMRQRLRSATRLTQRVPWLCGPASRRVCYFVEADGGQPRRAQRFSNVRRASPSYNRHWVPARQPADYEQPISTSLEGRRPHRRRPSALIAAPADIGTANGKATSLSAAITSGTEATLVEQLAAGQPGSNPSQGRANDRKLGVRPPKTIWTYPSLGGHDATVCSLLTSFVSHADDIACWKGNARAHLPAAAVAAVAADRG